MIYTGAVIWCYCYAYYLLFIKHRCQKQCSRTLMERSGGVISERYLDQWHIARRWWLTKRTGCRNTLWVLWDWFPFLLTTQCSGRSRNNFVSNCMRTFSLMSAPLSGEVCGSISDNCEIFQRKQPVSWNSFELGTFRLRSLSATELERNVWWTRCRGRKEKGHFVHACRKWTQFSCKTTSLLFSTVISRNNVANLSAKNCATKYLK